jgi:amidase
MIDHFSSASAMIEALAAKTVSATELLALHQQRIEKVDAQLNAVIIRDFDRARETATAIDNDKGIADQSQVLRGLPMTIKESINIQGLPTCCGISAAADFVSEHDAPTTTRLKAAGAVLMGKTNIPVELADWQSANPIYGRTNNPYDLSRSPGGSSGGSAAALASGMTPLEVGSDIGGSIRVPAAFCGVFGHRPSETALAKSGQFPYPPTPMPIALLGVQGPMARNATDLRLAMSVLGGAEIAEDRAWQLHLPAPRHTQLKDYRIATFNPPAFVPLAPSIRQAQETLVAQLRQEGCTVTEAQPDGFDWDELHELYLNLLGAMLGARAPEPIREERIKAMMASGEQGSMRMAKGMQASVPQLFAWLGAREQVRAAWRTFFADYDVFLAPATMRNAYPHLPLEGAPLISAIAETIDVDNQTVPYGFQVFYPGLCTLPGQPSTAFPVGMDEDGLPIGLQAIGPYLEDHTALHFVQCLETAGLSQFNPPKNFQ